MRAIRFITSKTEVGRPTGQIGGWSFGSVYAKSPPPAADWGPSSNWTENRGKPPRSLFLSVPIPCLQQRPNPWRQACYWWSVCYTLADVVRLFNSEHLRSKFEHLKCF